MANETILTLTGMGITPYSARGLNQTLVPIAQAAFARRNVNATLVDIAGSAFRKYRSTIQGDDIDPPEVDDIWPGMILTVGCIVELGYDATSPARPAVSGSEREEEGFKFYRPVLTMMIMNFEVERDEYGAAHSWSLDLEEV